ncbi:phenylalanine--tRNA ligase subunit beta [Sulfurimonas sp. MAG313]|nr:phenylalanine--tRNA ligase subunit beta [Sulfurimonas sp. MAG313]MDF1881535.1 phenylalanine--tRNA ligase subunit beta [Sulfurimonas sp. MAG313]
MIITKSWLNEWIDIEAKSGEELCKTFNSIGLEVDRHEVYNVPAKIVIGHVVSCEKHPDADKLNVCQVDIGTAVRQIVCGASNVRADIYVAVATIGAQMPGGLKIKPVELRGVESVGMICSSTELGLPQMEDGIMVLDESIGTLKLGEALCENPYFNDELIELELTANRGDCLSINGVARDLSAAYDIELKERQKSVAEEKQVGIGRILQLIHPKKTDVSLMYKAVKQNTFKLPLLLRLRLSMIEEECKSAMDALLFYATYSSGVILRAYGYSAFPLSQDKAQITLDTDENGYSITKGNTKISTIGIIQYDESRVQPEDEIVILEASYIHPDTISRKMAEKKIENGPLFYRTSRGSEPNLEFGLEYCQELFNTYAKTEIYGGSLELNSSYEETVLHMSIEEINDIIGMDVEKTNVTQVLKNLGFTMLKSQAGKIVVGVPQFRHDVSHSQDIVEEIVRLIGIDNIPSKPYSFTEQPHGNDASEFFAKRKFYRQKAASCGFFETVHFVFNERAKLKKFGFDVVEEALDLVNPIAGTLDTLRSTLNLGLLEAASLNAKVGRKQIKLFEVGSVFDALRHESIHMGFIFSGQETSESIENHGKPTSIGFEKFVQTVSNVIGDFELRPIDITHSLAHPYQSAEIFVNNKVLGTLFKLHPSIAKEYDLEDTYLCEISFDSLAYSLETFDAYSKFQASYRDLSLVIPKSLRYSELRSVISESQSAEVIRFYPVDTYESEELGDTMSLTLRFMLQSQDKTLEEEDITSSMDAILSALNEKLAIALR